jgi:hypothetical protein
MNVIMPASFDDRSVNHEVHLVYLGIEDSALHAFLQVAPSYVRGLDAGA